MRRIEAARLVWGLALLTAPRTVLRRVHGLAGDPVEVRVAQVLGARYAAQAVVTGLRPTPRMLLAGAIGDLAHGLSAVAYAALDPGRRRAAVTELAVAAGWTVVELHGSVCRGPVREEPGHDRHDPDDRR